MSRSYLAATAIGRIVCWCAAPARIALTSGFAPAWRAFSLDFVILAAFVADARHTQCARNVRAKKNRAGQEKHSDRH